MLTMNRLSAILCILLAASAVAQEYDCTYSDEISLHPESNSVFLQHYVNPAAGTFSMRIRYTGGDDRWIGIAGNYIDEPWMAPAYGIMGRANDPDPSGSTNSGKSVRRYWLEEEYEDGSGTIPYPDVNIHLKDGWSFVQENGETILEFTHDLVILDEENGTGDVEFTFTPETVWVWAVGLPNNQWEGIHLLHGAFNGLNLYNSCVPAAAPTDPPNPTPTPTDPPVDGGNTGEQDGDGDDSEEGSTDGDGTNADGEVDDGEDDEGDSTEVGALDGSNGDANEGSSTEVDSGSDTASSGSVWTNTPDSNNASPDGVQNSINFVETESSQTRPLWVAHGIFMGIAWGISAPIAIGVSVLRGTSLLSKNGTWLWLHTILMQSTVVLTTIGFIIAVAATKKENATPHFSEDTHHKVGLAIFILVLIQGLLGYIRPAATAQTEEEKQGTKGAENETSEDDDEEENQIATSQKKKRNSKKANDPSSESQEDQEVEPGYIQCMGSWFSDGSNQANNNDEGGIEVGPVPSAERRDAAVRSPDDDTPKKDIFRSPSSLAKQELDENLKEPDSINTSDDDVTMLSNDENARSASSSNSHNKSMIRQYWEYFHRSLGLILICLAWYNCHTGIVLQAANYLQDDEARLLNIFWSITGCIVGIFVFLGYVIRV